MAVAATTQSSRQANPLQMERQLGDKVEVPKADLTVFTEMETGQADPAS